MKNYFFIVGLPVTVHVRKLYRNMIECTHTLTCMCTTGKYSNFNSTTLYYSHCEMITVCVYTVFVSSHTSAQFYVI